MTVDPPNETAADEAKPTADDADPHATVRGPWLVAATLSLFVLVPLGVWGAITLVQRDMADRETGPLVWADRTAWPAMDVRGKSLERGLMSQGRTGEKYKDYGFHPDAELIASVTRCRRLVSASDVDFTDDAVRVALETEADARPDNFYAAALLAQWHEQRGDPAGADAWWEQAFLAAPAAVTQRVVDTAGTVRLGASVGQVAFAFDQVNDDTVDPTLVIVYPDVTTGADGVWRLPVFKTLVRVIDPPLAPAVGNDPARSPWLTFAGPVGRLPDAVDASSSEELAVPAKP